MPPLFLKLGLEKNAAICKTTAASTQTETVDDDAEADEGGQAVSSSLVGHCGAPSHLSTTSRIVTTTMATKVKEVIR